MPRYLGQHFLKNKEKLQEIIKALDLKSGDVVIEIGPGKGALTIPLLEECKKLDCKIIEIEKDKLFAGDLKEKFKNNKNVEIIEGDILKILPKLTTDYGLQTTNYKIVGNIPYYITGYLFRILGELENKSESIVLLIQKEVAERVCAKKGDMNLLAASVQFWAEPKIIGYVSKNDFSPPPKVESAIIKLTPITLDRRSSMQCNEDDYYKFIKILFKQPRKTILNNLLSGIADKNTAIPADSPLSYGIVGDKKEKIDKNENKEYKNELQVINKEKIIEKLKLIGVNPQGRPQDLDIEKIIEILELLIA